MLLTEEIIYDRIRDSKYPFWSLFLQQGFKNTSHIMSYWGQDFEENDSEETKIQKSIARLKNIVKSIKNANFTIDIKNAKNATGAAIIGPLEFTNVVKTEPVPQLAGVGTVSDSYLEGFKKQLENEFELKLDNYKKEISQKQYEEKLKKREEELEEREKEIKDLKKGYESGVAKVADILVEAGTRLAMNLFPDMFGTGSGAIQPAQQIQLSGSEPTTTTTAMNDEKAKAVDNFAEFLYNNFEKDDIEKLMYNIKKATENELERQSNTEQSESDSY